MTNKRALLLVEWKQVDDEFIEEVKIWRVPVSPTYPHGLSFRLWFGRPGETLVLYDVHHGKPYHVHRGSAESPYEFSDLDTLFRDFFADRAHYQ